MFTKKEKNLVRERRKKEKISINKRENRERGKRWEGEEIGYKLKERNSGAEKSKEKNVAWKKRVRVAKKEGSKKGKKPKLGEISLILRGRKT